MKASVLFGNPGRLFHSQPDKMTSVSGKFTYKTIIKQQMPPEKFQMASEV